jgi:arylsulfatase A-like enzyme
MRRSTLAAIAVVVAVIASGCSSDSKHVSAPTNAKKPNIVFVLTDDLDYQTFLNAANFPVFHDLMVNQGLSFDDYFVTDSLCCPSRASILRGQYVHDHGVLTNIPPKGGFEHWTELKNDTSTVATWMHDAGYRTALFGKYLNGYPTTVSHTYIPPGWDEWAVPNRGNAYAEYNYGLNENGTSKRYGSKPTDYLVDVLTAKAKDFIDRAPATGKPFFMYVAPYVPHQPATPAPRYDKTFPGAKQPRVPSFNQKDVKGEPRYVSDRNLLDVGQIQGIDALYRRREQSMLGVQDMLRTIVDQLKATNQLDNTYIVFTSDNGFHLGQHRLPPGKQTPYEEDIHVPLVVRGPGIAPGTHTARFTREIDLAPTFAALAGGHAADFVDGVSFDPTLHGQSDPAAPKDALIEHYSAPGSRAGRVADASVRLAATDPDDDANPPTAGAPTTGPDKPVTQPRAKKLGIPTYTALRTDRYMYASYATGEKQLFDVQADPYELHNIVTSADPALVRSLAARLAQLSHCHAETCRT